MRVCKNMVLIFSQAAISVKISNLLICFCSFDLYIFILYCLVSLNRVLF